jgi:pimeloyl-ACP methyl ester carboxylesterase
LGVATLHGQAVAYQEVAGPGPVLLLVHGVGSNRRTWDTVVPRLAESGAHLIVVDLPGHGASGKGPGDYSLGSLASTLRDLLGHLGHAQAVLVGHSLGGGVALQFAYQYPERCAGLVLVASGGLGREASPLLRAATLPGSEIVIGLIAHRRALSTIAVLTRVLTQVRGAQVLPDDALTTLAELEDADNRAAFLATLRSVVDTTGQRVSALPKLASTAHLPVLLVWGDRDAIIPIEHGQQALSELANARLVIFPGAGHEPHRHDPERFTTLLIQYAAAATNTDRSAASEDRRTAR